MAKTTFFASNSAFEKEFSRCCNQYSKLDMYVAWIGDPKNLLPFNYLKKVKEISAVIGVAFCQSHPEGLKWLLGIAKYLRIAKDKTLYHPKVYIFSEGQKRAIFIGSSNFTHQGFYINNEVNILIEGTNSDSETTEFEKNLTIWASDEFSFNPDYKWLKKYEERYKKRREKLKKAGLEEEAEYEEELNTAAWLANAPWAYYVNLVKEGLNESGNFKKKLNDKIEFFNLIGNKLPTPWPVEYFNDIENRRLIGGMNPYGWLGHVGASGDFRRIMKNGANSEQKVIVDSINMIAGLSIPLNWDHVKDILENLISLGPTMKVWSRLLPNWLKVCRELSTYRYEGTRMLYER